jgi:hypothetical protein
MLEYICIKSCGIKKKKKKKKKNWLKKKKKKKLIKLNLIT